MYGDDAVEGNEQFTLENRSECYESIEEQSVFDELVIDEVTKTIMSFTVSYWRSERSERRHIQVMTIKICDIYIIYKYVKFDHNAHVR